jgi:hypothetical protein
VVSKGFAFGWGAGGKAPCVFCEIRKEKKSKGKEINLKEKSGK